MATSHNKKYVQVSDDPPHYRTFKIEYESRQVRGRTRSFQTEEEAERFIDRLEHLAEGDPDLFYQLSQVDQIIKRLRAR